MSLSPSPSPSTIKAVTITRGGYDISPVFQSLDNRGFSRIQIYDNSVYLDFKVFSRFIAAQSAIPGWVYTQDDDVIVDLAHYPWHLTTKDRILSNMPAAYRPNYPGPVQLLGFGSIFHTSLVRPTFDRYFRHFPIDELFLIECDRVFTALNTCTLIDVPITHMPYATSDGRLYKQSGHSTRRREIERRIQYVLDFEQR